MDLDHTLRMDTPIAIMAQSTNEQKTANQNWERSNRMSPMIMKSSIFIAIRGEILDSNDAKTYLAFVEEQFKGSFKAHASTLIMKMLTTRYDGTSGVRENIMMMNDMTYKLKGIEMAISEGFLVHFIMTSLPM
ncbi:UBN2_2 domain-containing protein [Cephalotus follicularis]|uniref:UBN2_2 domain-containing protein n=1 Tax=Cephalotus follicularis TaxID=3775 RepID=A0A1Q3CZF6_CEPFO|nr:UBN2_2 domain-containing protein [Cephalotus follicularis]